jgi:hypothetical protein
MDIMHPSVLNDPNLFIKLFTGKLDLYKLDDRAGQFSIVKILATMTLFGALLPWAWQCSTAAGGAFLQAQVMWSVIHMVGKAAYSA